MRLVNRRLTNLPIYFGVLLNLKLGTIFLKGLGFSEEAGVTSVVAGLGKRLIVFLNVIGDNPVGTGASKTRGALFPKDNEGRLKTNG